MSAKVFLGPIECLPGVLTFKSRPWSHSVSLLGGFVVELNYAKHILSCKLFNDPISFPTRKLRKFISQSVKPFPLKSQIHHMLCTDSLICLQLKTCSEPRFQPLFSFASQLIFKTEALYNLWSPFVNHS